MMDIRFSSPARRSGTDEASYEAPAAASQGWSSRGTLFKGPHFEFGFTRCRPENDCVGPEKHSGLNVLTFPRRGLFRMHMSDVVFVADPNTVIFQNADDTFRTSHPGGRGDETTWVAVAPEFISDSLETDVEAAHPFAASHATSTPRCFLLQRLLFEYAMRGRAADNARIVLLVHALVRESISLSRPAPDDKPARMRESTLRVHVECAEAVKILLAQRFTERLTLEQIAAHVHTAPCHLCRLFRRVVGLPIHRYLNRLRLREAITRFADPSMNLAGVALDVGFASHSHFTDAFRREFGVPPSTVRQWIMAPNFDEIDARLGVGGSAAAC